MVDVLPKTHEIYCWLVDPAKEFAREPHHLQIRLSDDYPASSRQISFSQDRHQDHLTPREIVFSSSKSDESRSAVSKARVSPLLQKESGLFDLSITCSITSPGSEHKKAPEYRGQIRLARPEV